MVAKKRFRETIRAQLCYRLLIKLELTDEEQECEEDDEGGDE